MPTHSVETHNHSGVYAPVLGADDNYATDAEKVKLSNLSGTNTGDQTSIVGITGTKAQFNTAVSDGDVLYVGDVTSNATHTGDATGATALAVVKIQGKDFPALGAGDDQKYPKYVSASNAFVMTTIAGGGDVVGPAASVDSEIALYSSTTGKLLKRASTTGLLKATAGVLAAAVEGTDYARPYTLVATLAGNQATGADVNPVTLTGLVWTYAANSVYFFRFIGQTTAAAATTGAGFQLDCSSAVTEISMGFYHQLANTGTLSGGSSLADDTSAGVSSGRPATTALPVLGEGMLRTGANTGTAQLRFRAEVAAVTTCLAGFTLVVERVT